MDKILRNIYFDGLFPQNMLENNEQLSSALVVCSKCEEELTASLSGGEKEKLMKLVDAQSEISGCQSVSNFLLGMRLGAQLTQVLLN